MAVPAGIRAVRDASSDSLAPQAMCDAVQARLAGYPDKVPCTLSLSYSSGLTVLHSHTSCLTSQAWAR